MGHFHDHKVQLTHRGRLCWSIAIVATVLVIEIVGGWLSGSLALVADAGHMVSDLIGLIIALVASIIAAQPATDRQTFGYRRVEVFAALINGVILLVVAVSVTVGALERLTTNQPGEVQSGPMLVVAVVGLMANALALLLLRSGARQSLNLRGAYLEVFGDLIGSVAVIFAALVILFTGFRQADALASLFIAACIVPRAVILLRDVVRIFSEAVPQGTDVADVRNHILNTAGVTAVHDVHVWAITSGSNVFSAHVEVAPTIFTRGQSGELLTQLSECLRDHFDVDHSTFQLEPAGHGKQEHPPLC
ncbi:MAG: cation transporter [Candidatus Lumbricidophila eiseniae]|uniref:Cation transporter n=1 Tax=Candidatus Lumbricidiphila eiseniae TaxID=1969409 RepID=A0A2A6FRM8_9MICO|nr:MAG: cation transporter [Candidatus Lumbricidophila eiseniae]